MNYEEAKQIPISDIREKLGHSSDYLSGCDDAVAYVEAYLKSCGEDHTRVDALRWLKKFFRQRKNQQPSPTAKKAKIQNLKWRIARRDDLEDLALIRYLENRGISAEVAKEHLQEIYLRNKCKNEGMYALAFPNEEGGFAILNPFIETQVGNEGISIVRHHDGLQKTIHVFANFLDMLSAFTAFPEMRNHADVICLNSLQHLDDAFAHILGFGYAVIYSWMPNTKRGKKLTNKLTKLVTEDQGLKHMVCNDVYKKYQTVAMWRKSKVS